MGNESLDPERSVSAVQAQETTKDKRADSLFSRNWYFGSRKPYPIVEVITRMESEGAGPLDIELLPDAVALLVEEAAEQDDVIAPQYYPEGDYGRT